jgi:hypothetical protein
MPARPLDGAELEAIAAWLGEHAPTRCPATDRGAPLPFLQSVEIMAMQGGLGAPGDGAPGGLRRHRAAAYLRMD